MTLRIKCYTDFLETAVDIAQIPEGIISFLRTRYKRKIALGLEPDTARWKPHRKILDMRGIVGKLAAAVIVLRMTLCKITGNNSQQKTIKRGTDND
jgi:hypothetical protein